MTWKYFSCSVGYFFILLLSCAMQKLFRLVYYLSIYTIVYLSIFAFVAFAFDVKSKKHFQD